MVQPITGPGMPLTFTRCPGSGLCWPGVQPRSGLGSRGLARHGHGHMGAGGGAATGAGCFSSLQHDLLPDLHLVELFLHGGHLRLERLNLLAQFSLRLVRRGAGGQRIPVPGAQR